jgi:hypothetical protein
VKQHFQFALILAALFLSHNVACLADDSKIVFEEDNHMVVGPVGASSFNRYVNFEVIRHDKMQANLEVSCDADWIAFEMVNDKTMRLSIYDGPEPINRKGSNQLRLKMDNNKSNLPRKGTIKINDQSVTITQEGGACRGGTDLKVIYSQNDDVHKEVNVVVTDDSCQWSVKSDSDWLKVTPSIGAGSGIVSVNLEKNPGKGERRADIELVIFDRSTGEEMKSSVAVYQRTLKEKPVDPKVRTITLK